MPSEEIKGNPKEAKQTYARALWMDGAGLVDTVGDAMS
jgi:hypothetical protein